MTEKIRRQKQRRLKPAATDGQLGAARVIFRVFSYKNIRYFL
jgi:hypothetical protein